jgi:lipoprotein-anchoring transpeptidase ErfK/SrfK
MNVFRMIALAGMFTALLQTPTPVNAQDSVENREPYTGVSICSPGMDPVDGCQINGPVKTQMEWQAKGLSYPLMGLPAFTPDAGYNEMPYRYAAINADPKREVRLFPSLDDAVAAENQSGSIPPGALRWVAYVSQVDVNGNHYVQLPDSFEWVRASPASVFTFQGLAFYQTPDHNFGWLGDHTTSRIAPSLESASTGKRYLRNEIVQIFGYGQGNNEEWVQIGIDEWVESRFVKKVNINTAPPDGVTNNRWIEVNLYEQTLAVYDNRQLVFATMVASGMDPFFTKPGLFQIREKKETEKMTGAFEADRSDYYSLDKVPWTMYFDGARALHAAYWRTMLGYPQSHGCVNLAPGDARFLFEWAKEGDWVYVWDPSGKTPTDPAKYGEGGA